MRGVVLEETTLRLSLLEAAAFVFVSGRNDFCNGGLPEPRRADNHAADAVSSLLDSYISLGADSRTSLYPDTLNSWFTPEDILMVTTPQLGPSGSKRSHSDADKELSVKKPCCIVPPELWSFSDAAMSNEPGYAAADGTDRHCNTTETANTAQQHDASASTALTTPIRERSLIVENDQDWVDWSDVFYRTPAAGTPQVTEIPACDVNQESVTLDQGMALFAELSDFVQGSISADATAPAFESMPALVLPANSGLAQQLDEEWIQDLLSVADDHRVPRQQDNARSGAIAEALTSPVPEFSQDHLMAGASDVGASPTHSKHSETSTSSVQFSSHEGNAPEQTPKSSASTSGEVSLQPLIWGRPQIFEGLSERSRRALNEEGSAIYDTARELLLSSDGAKNIRRGELEGTRTRIRSNMANSPYLGSSWLLERLVLQDKVPAYFVDLQTAFECYGYDSVSIPDVLQRALDLAFTLKQLDKVVISNPQLYFSRDSLVFFKWAAEIIRDAFFRGRPLRPDLKTYLRNKLKHETCNAVTLPSVWGCVRKVKGNMKNVYLDFRKIKRVINYKASRSHPLDFISFFDDVYTLVRMDNCLRKTLEGSSASTETKEQAGATIYVKSDEVIAVLTKYKRLFEMDLVAEVEALLKVAPDPSGPYLLRRAIEDGYVPFDWFQNDLVESNKFYNLNAHCLLGSLTTLYRRLIENPQETSSVDTNDKGTSSGVDESDGGSKLDVVQEYLLQPSPTSNKEGILSVEKFDPISAASEALELWKQNLNSFPSHRSSHRIPIGIVPFIRLHAPFGSPHWILTQLMDLSRGEHHRRRDDLKCALDLCGYGSVNTTDVFARALVLAGAVLTKCEVPFDDANELLKLPRDSQAYFLAADIIQAALFHTWPQSRNLTEYFATQLRYKVSPHHKECLSEVLAKREEWHPSNKLRIRKGDKAVVADWVRVRTAKRLSMKDMAGDVHLLSFDRFWEDVALLNEGKDPGIPAIASKYKLLFNRDIVEDLNTIREQAPQICYSDSFMKGIEEGYVPYRYAHLLTVMRSETLMVNNNALLLLGAIVEYYMSLVCPANTTMSQETSTRRDTTSSLETSLTKTLSSGHERKADCQFRVPPEEQTAQMMEILRRAPAQEPPTARVATTESSELHLVAQYLLGRC